MTEPRLVLVLLVAVLGELAASLHFFARIGDISPELLMAVVPPSCLAGLIGFNIVQRSQTILRRSLGVGVAIVLLVLHYFWGTAIYGFTITGIVVVGYILASVVLFSVYVALILTDNEL